MSVPCYDTQVHAELRDCPSPCSWEYTLSGATGNYTHPLPGDGGGPQGLGNWLFPKTKTSGKVRLLKPDACLQVPGIGALLTHTLSIIFSICQRLENLCVGIAGCFRVFRKTGTQGTFLQTQPMCFPDWVGGRSEQGHFFSFPVCFIFFICRDIRSSIIM